MDRQGKEPVVEGGALYVVATPIGNLQDMSFRALEVLGGVDVVACEDTRETGKLLDSFETRASSLISYHAQSRDSREDEILTALQEGLSVALVSDRGTPGISDPGSRLIARAVEKGVRVVPVPGASALIAALMASGADTSQFTYRGFMPHKKGRQTMLTGVAEECQERTVVFYESPHRIIKTLVALEPLVKQVVLARELTKLYEEFLRGTPAELIDRLEVEGSARGEFVVIVPKQ